MTLPTYKNGKGYQEVTPKNFALIGLLLKDMEANRPEISKIVNSGKFTIDKPSWIINDVVANCILWRYKIVVEGQ